MNLPLRPYLRLLSEYLARQRGRLLLLGLLIFGSIGLQLLNPQILRAFIDAARAGGAAEALTRAALLFIGLALAQHALAVLEAGRIVERGQRAELADDPESRFAELLRTGLEEVLR